MLVEHRIVHWHRALARDVGGNRELLRAVERQLEIAVFERETRKPPFARGMTMPAILGSPPALFPGRPCLASMAES